MTKLKFPILSDIGNTIKGWAPSLSALAARVASITDHKWDNWQPQLTYSAMNFTSVSAPRARYLVVDQTCYFNLELSFTTTATPEYYLGVSLPVPAIRKTVCQGFIDSAFLPLPLRPSGNVFLTCDNGSSALVYKTDRSILDASKIFHVNINGFYEAK